MKYLYKCTNQDCKENEIPKEINKPISEASKEEYCTECEHQMQKIYSISGHKTFSDGYKG